MVDSGPTDAAAATWGLSHALAGVARSVASAVRSLAHQLSLRKKSPGMCWSRPVADSVTRGQKNGHFARYVLVIALKYMCFQ